MIRIESTEKLMELICGRIGAGAFGSGDISLSPKCGRDFVKLYDGGIVRIKAVLSAGGNCGRKELLSRIDSAAMKAAEIRGDGIICIRSPYPPIITDADEKGYLRFEKELEIIYLGEI